MLDILIDIVFLYYVGVVSGESGPTTPASGPMTPAPGQSTTHSSPDLETDLSGDLELTESGHDGSGGKQGIIVKFQYSYIIISHQMSLATLCKLKPALVGLVAALVVQVLPMTNESIRGEVKIISGLF